MVIIVFFYFSVYFSNQEYNFYSCKSFRIGDDMMAKKEDYLTTAPKNQQVTINNGSHFPNQKHLPGDSVEEYEYQKEANLLLTGDEIHQQNENL
jgi:hypothetical protein